MSDELFVTHDKSTVSPRVKSVRGQSMVIEHSENLKLACVKEAESMALDRLLAQVYHDSGYDFREYKRGTVMRRLQRRLYATGTSTYSEYTHFLRNHFEEYERLVDDLTIKVSGFMRSSYTFLQMSRLILPELILCKRQQGQRTLRFWSTACAHGEEPYSIAMVLAEYLGQGLQEFNIEIYATDISKRTLHEAQTSAYSLKEVGNLSPSLLKSYFTSQDKNYTVASNIKRMVKFSRFDLVSSTNSPFANVDCIFCCNILIYLQKQLQERVLRRLCNSLAVPGYLILGEVETPSDNLLGKLECLDIKAKIYKKDGRNEYV